MNVAIVGAGIAGLTTAVALTERGISCQVYERAQQSRPQGTGLLLGPNALQVLERLGLREPVHLEGFEPNVLGGFRPNGEPISTVTAADYESRYGYRPLAVHRAVLHRVLGTRLASGIVRYGSELTSFEQTADGVRVKFADGTVVGCDLLVGADGLRSMIREQLFGRTHYRYGRQACFLGISEFVVSAGPFRDNLAEIWGSERGLRVGLVPIDRRRTYFFATHYAKQPSNGGARVIEPTELESIFSEFPAEVHELFAHVRPGDLYRTDILDFEPLARWHAGRVVLVGDAAHAITPNLGQGACQAMESAFVLARELAEKPPSDALDSYVALRRDKMRFVRDMSWRFGQIVNLPGPFGRFVRHFVMPRAPKSGMWKSMDRIYRVDF